MLPFQQPALATAEIVARWLADVQKHPEDEQLPELLAPQSPSFVDRVSPSLPR